MKTTAQFRPLDWVCPASLHYAEQLGVGKADLAHPDVISKLVTGVKSWETWVEAPIGDKWIVAYRMIPQHGILVISELRLFPNEKNRPQPGRWSGEILGAKAQAPRGGITARLVRDIKTGEHHRFAGVILEQFANKYGDVAFQGQGIFGRRHISAPEVPSKSTRGRKGEPDIFYAKLAEQYCRLLGKGSKRPVVEIARRRRPRRRLSQKQQKREQNKVKAMIHRARLKGMLSEAQQGRRGGRLTERARRILSRENSRSNRSVGISVVESSGKVEELRGKLRKTTSL